jgi:hypothetical protein
VRQVVRLVENDRVPGEATTRAVRAGHEPEPLTVLQLDRGLLVRLVVGPDLLVELGGVLAQVADPQERLDRGLHLVRAVDDRALTEQEQPGQFARLKDAALAVLPGDDQPDLERRPLAVRPLTEGDPENVLLPGSRSKPAMPASSTASSPEVRAALGDDSTRGR